MTILYFLIPLALLLMAGALWALFWAIRTGQFDDLESQGWSVVLDEDRELPASGKPAVPAGKEKADEGEGTWARK
jgi:cbb3-type cytochrome oxidase maturation protein